MTKYCSGVLFLFILTLPIMAQDRFVNSFLNAPQYRTSYFLHEPFSMVAEKPRLETSSQLRELGAAYFELTGISNSRVTLRLFDSAKVPKATIELKLEKEDKGATFVYTIHGADSDAWIRISSQETNSTVFYKTLTSAGQEYRVRVQFAPEGQGYVLHVNNKAIRAISTIYGRQVATEVTSIFPRA